MRREKLHYIAKIQDEIAAHSRQYGRIHRLAEFELREQLAEFIVGPRREHIRTGDYGKIPQPHGVCADRPARCGAVYRAWADGYQLLAGRGGIQVIERIVNIALVGLASVPVVMIVAWGLMEGLGEMFPQSGKGKEERWE
jgi:hypothetical protein